MDLGYNIRARRYMKHPKLFLVEGAKYERGGVFAICSCSAGEKYCSFLKLFPESICPAYDDDSYHGTIQ